MKVLSLIDKHLEEVLCAIILGLMTIVIFLQVALRTMQLPLYWTEEVGRYLFIWLIYMPMSIPYSSVLVGSVLMAFRLIQDTIARFKERKEALAAHD